MPQKPRTPKAPPEPPEPPNEKDNPSTSINAGSQLDLESTLASIVELEESLEFLLKGKKYSVQGFGSSQQLFDRQVKELGRLIKSYAATGGDPAIVNNKRRKLEQLMFRRNRPPFGG